MRGTFEDQGGAAPGRRLARTSGPPWPGAGHRISKPAMRFRLVYEGELRASHDKQKRPVGGTQTVNPKAFPSAAEAPLDDQ